MQELWGSACQNHEHLSKYEQKNRAGNADSDLRKCFDDLHFISFGRHNIKKRDLKTGGGLVMIKLPSALVFLSSLISCGQGSNKSELNDTEALIKLNIQKGMDVDAGLAFLSSNGFVCKIFKARSDDRHRRSYICQKVIKERRAIQTHIHSIVVSLDADDGGKLEAYDVIIGRGGPSGL